MSHQPATERQVWDWLTDLGKLVAPGNASVREASGQYLPLLIGEFDSRDFNADSRAFVARHCKFWPSYGELCELLSKWPKPVPPPPRGATEPGNLSGMDLHWFRYFYKRQAENFGPARSGQPSSDRETILAMIRDKSPPAWHRITGTPLPIHGPPLQADGTPRKRITEEEDEADEYRTPPRPNLPPRPAPDVSLKGDALRKARANCGLNVPVPEPAPEPHEVLF